MGNIDAAIWDFVVNNPVVFDILSFIASGVQ